jgi:multiple sugar transport system permease protein
MSMNIFNTKRFELGKSEISESKMAYILILPALFLIFGLGVYPISYTIWLSFQKLQLIEGGSGFVGLQHYIRMLQDKTFWNAMGLTIYFTVVSLIVQIILGIAVAFLLNKKFRGRSFMRAIILIPWSVPTVVNATMWGWIYNASFGALNRLLLQLGVIAKPVMWLGSAYLAMNMIILADTWRMLPLYVIMLIAALQTIPDSLTEAADIDGAGLWHKLRYIYLPLLKPMILIILVLRTIQAFRVFDIIYVLTQGGPANGTMVISFYGYFQTFKYLNFGYGSAVSVFVALFTMFIAMIYIRVLRLEER